MDIEEIAVLAVRTEIVKYSDTLVAYIDTKEKTPMWDGYIYVYKQNSKYKSVHTRVKMTEEKSHLFFLT